MINGFPLPDTHRNFNLPSLRDVTMHKPLALLIKRTSRAKDEEPIRGYWQKFHVTVAEQAYVLDALEAAWRQDSSLMFRHSCHHTSCGHLLST